MSTTGTRATHLPENDVIALLGEPGCDVDVRALATLQAARRRITTLALAACCASPEDYPAAWRVLVDACDDWRRLVERGGT